MDWPATLGAILEMCQFAYNVGTKIVTNLLSLYPKFSTLVVMLQKEVAEKMVAKVGDRNRGLIRFCSDIFTARSIIRVPRGALPSKVESAVVLLEVNPHLSSRIQHPN